MPLRLKKLIGTLLLIALVIVYAFAAVAVAVAQLAEASAAVRMLFFAVGGLIWILPAMLIIRWMAGPKAKDPS